MTRPALSTFAELLRPLVALRGGLVVAFFVCTLSFSTTVFAAKPQAAVDMAGEQFFENSIRPLLAEKCFNCHGRGKQEGGLRLDTQVDLLKGGDSGAIVEPGHPEHSLMVKAIEYKDSSLQMPPSKKLTERQVADLSRWVKMGAPWPAQVAKPQAASVETNITAPERSWWSFQPIRRPAPPPVHHSDRVANPIDAFVLAKLEAKGLEPNPPADKRTLIRRAYFDLIGLPPSPAEIETFMASTDPNAYEKLLDRLLERPEYGERWARFWLDIVRYGQTNGYERDDEKPEAWRYRDYVIHAFNDDKPYDQFIREQLAGDELDHVTDDTIIATGYYHLGLHDDEPDDRNAADYDELDDVVRTTSTAFLGLTVGCARCHDHKFDPIPQADYYRFLSFFHNIQHIDKNQPNASYRSLGDVAGDEKDDAKRQRELRDLSEQLIRLKSAAQKSGAKTVSPELKQVRERLNVLKHGRLAGELALAVRETGSTPRKTNILIRGNASTAGAEVQPAFLTVLGAEKPLLVKLPDQQSTGLRRALSQWLTSPKNPLPARVMANRIWQYHFGKGIVATPDDFGKTGIPPTHPELLDYLAGHFIDSGWSVKSLQKLIMMSGVYRMSSQSQSEATSQSTASRNVLVDPGNDLLWRQNMHRLEGEAIRDSILAVSGKLNPASGGRGFFPKASRELIAGGSKPGRGWGVSSPAECARRSIYAFVKRSMIPSLLDAFDYNNTTMPSGVRSVTTVSPQALMLLNDDFLQDQAAAFAQRITDQAGPDIAKQIACAFALALGRQPTEIEQQTATAYIDRQAKRFKAIQTHVIFRPQVPSPLAEDYLEKLGDEDFLSGPRAGWAFTRGIWGNGYENIVSLICPLTNSPAALDNNIRFTDGTVTGRIMLAEGAELAAVIVRGKQIGHETHAGYDFVFDPKAKTIALQRHGNAANEVTILATSPLSMNPGHWISFRIEAVGGRLRAWADADSVSISRKAKPLIEVTDLKPLAESGSFGVRAWGAAATFEKTYVRFGNERVRLVESSLESGRPQYKALQSFCLVLFNLNEFLYVD